MKQQMTAHGYIVVHKIEDFLGASIDVKKHFSF